MKLLKRFNMEQLAAAAAGAIAVAGLLAAAWSGASSSVHIDAPSEQERAYKGPPVRSAELPDAAFEAYWKGGRNPFESAATSQLPLPQLRPPEPVVDAVTLPALRPGPSSDALNRLGGGRYWTLKAAKPAWVDADLPAAAEVDGLKAIVEPELPALPDKRAEKEHAEDIIHLVGDQAPVVGTIRAQLKDGSIVIVLKGGSASRTIAPGDMAKDPEFPSEKWIDRSWTHEERYRRRLQRIRDTEVEKYLALARWARERGMMPEAKQAYRCAIDAARKRNEFRSEAIAAIRELGDICQQTTDYEAMLALFQEVVALPIPEKAEFHARLGDALKAIGAVEAAVESYRTSITESPRYIRGRVQLARSLLEAGREEEALSLLAAMATYIVKETPPAQLAEAKVLQGWGRLRLGDLKSAREALAEALRIDPQSAEALTINGVVAAMDGKGKEASAAFGQALKANQYAIDAWLNLGTMFLGAGKAAEAEAMFQAAAVRDPASADPVAGLALVALLKGAPADAQAALDRAFAIDPGHVYSHYVAAALLPASGGDVGKAVAHYQAVLNADFSYAPAYVGAASMYIATARARELDAQAVAERDPKAADKLWRDSETQLIRAATLLSTARQIAPDRWTTPFALACVYSMQGRAEEAREALSIAQTKLAGADPLLSYAFGWIEYRFGQGDAKSRMEAARTFFTAGARMTGGSPWSAECAVAVQHATDWLETVVRLDDRFEGRQGEKVGAGWIEYDGRFGVKIAVDKGRCVFSGKQDQRDLFLTSLERDVPRPAFLSYEATLYPGSTSRCEYGIAVLLSKLGPKDSDPWQGFWVGFDMAGKLHYVLQSTQEANGGRLDVGAPELKVTPPDPKEIRLKVERREPRPGQRVFDILLWNPATAAWDAALKDIPALDTGGGTTYRVVVWGRAQKASEYSFSVDNVRVLERVKP